MDSRLGRRVPALLFALALPAAAQTPTPTPTPTPPPNASIVTAGVTVLNMPDTATYDSANVIVDDDGSLWTASGPLNRITHLSSDGATLRSWSFPSSVTPSSLLKDADGTFWFTELGGFNVGHFDPSTGSVTEWPDRLRRPTALYKRPDGKFWLPETGGPLALFDPVQNLFTYYTPLAYTLSYPWVDSDGSLFACDFIYYGIVKFSADGSTYSRWDLPTDYYYVPSKIRRMPDGGLWISFWGSGQLGRFDDSTGELKIFNLEVGSHPYDLQPYRGRILFGEQSTGAIGFFDPAAATPSNVVTLTLTTGSTIVDTWATAPSAQTLTPTDANPTGFVTRGSMGYALAGETLLPTTLGSPVWGISIDERRARIWFNTAGSIGQLLPPLPTTGGDIYVLQARSAQGPAGLTYQTRTVAWNRGTPDASNVVSDMNPSEILLPNGWIAGFQPITSVTVPATKLVAQADVIGTDMSAPGHVGTIRFTTAGSSTDLFVAARTVTSTASGGTYGCAQNGLTVADALKPGDTGYLIVPPGDASKFVYAGAEVLNASTGTISIYDSSGNNLGTYHYDWPAGFQAEGQTIWDAFGMAPVPGGRVVFSVATGNLFPFGMEFDEATGDPITLDVMKPAGAVTTQTLPFVTRGGGPLGPTSQTSLQVANPGATNAVVSFSYRPSSTVALSPPGPVSLPAITVPAGQVVSLPDLLATAGSGPLIGALDISSDQPVHAFARVLGSVDGGGSFGLGASAAAPVASGSKGVFLGLADNAASQSDLVLINQGAVSASVTVNLFGADGGAAGSTAVDLAPNEVRFIPSVWPLLAGASTDLGRLEVIPADGAGPVSATLVRSDRLTLDADAIVPFVIPR